MDYGLVLEYSEKQELVGTVEEWQGRGEVREPGCDDILEITLKTRREVVTEIRYTITEKACRPVKACAALAVEMALGKPVMEAYLICADRLSEFFGGLNRESYHCALMAEIAVKKAVKDYVSRRNAA